MKYYGLSSILATGALQEAHKREIFQSLRGEPFSADTMFACHRVASGMDGTSKLVIVRSEGVATRFAYLSEPSYEEWLRFERACFVETVYDGFGFTINALH